MKSLFNKFSESTKVIIEETRPVRIYKDTTHVFIYFKDLEDEMTGDAFDVMSLKW